MTHFKMMLLSAFAVLPAQAIKADLEIGKHGDQSSERGPLLSESSDAQPTFAMPTTQTTIEFRPRVKLEKSTYKSADDQRDLETIHVKYDVAEASTVENENGVVELTAPDFLTASAFLRTHSKNGRSAFKGSAVPTITMTTHDRDGRNVTIGAVYKPVSASVWGLQTGTNNLKAHWVYEIYAGTDGVSSVQIPPGCQFTIDAQQQIQGLQRFESVSLFNGFVVTGISEDGNDIDGFATSVTLPFVPSQSGQFVSQVKRFNDEIEVSNAASVYEAWGTSKFDASGTPAIRAGLEAALNEYKTKAGHALFALDQYFKSNPRSTPANREEAFAEAWGLDLSAFEMHVGTTHKIEEGEWFVVNCAFSNVEFIGANGAPFHFQWGDRIKPIRDLQGAEIHYRARSPAGFQSTEGKDYVIRFRVESVSLRQSHWNEIRKRSPAGSAMHNVPGMPDVKNCNSLTTVIERLGGLLNTVANDGTIIAELTALAKPECKSVCSAPRELVLFAHTQPAARRAAPTASMAPRNPPETQTIAAGVARDVPGAREARLKTRSKSAPASTRVREAACKARHLAARTGLRGSESASTTSL